MVYLKQGRGPGHTSLPRRLLPHQQRELPQSLPGTRVALQDSQLLTNSGAEKAVLGPYTQSNPPPGRLQATGWQGHFPSPPVPCGVSFFICEMREQDPWSSCDPASPITPAPLLHSPVTLPWRGGAQELVMMQGAPAQCPAWPRAPLLLGPDPALPPMRSVTSLGGSQGWCTEALSTYSLMNTWMNKQIGRGDQQTPLRGLFWI